MVSPKVVLNYPMVSPKVPTTLMTPYSYLMGQYGHSFVSKISQKQMKTGFWRYLPKYPLIPHSNMFYGPTSGIKLSYGITQGAYYTLDPFSLWATISTHLYVSSITGFQLFSAISAHKWGAMLAYRVTIWGHECSKNLGWYHTIIKHHLLAHRTDFCVE